MSLEIPEFQSSDVANFYIDESSIEIEEKPHVIVCGILTENPAKTALEMVALKESLGYAALDEVKLNTKGLTQDLKIKLTDGVLEIIGACTAFVSIHEGVDKQPAAEMIAVQAHEFCAERNIPAYALNYDRDLVPSRRKLEDFVRNSLGTDAKCIGIQHLDSANEQNIQFCDVFLGLYRLAIQIELGERQISRKVYTPSIDDEDDWSLSDYVTLSSRGCVWGKMERRASEIHEEYGEISHPYHCSFGLGLRMKSSISDTTLKLIQDNLATTYMGCLS